MVIMGNVWDRATEFLSDNLSAVVPLALFAIFLPMSLQASLEPLAKSGPAAALTVNAVQLIVGVVSLWGQIAIIALALDPMAGRPAAMRLAGRRLLPMIGIAALLLAGLLLLVTPVGFALGFAGFDVTAAMAGSQQEIPAGASGFIAIYSLILVIVIIWLGARLALLYPIVVYERRGIGVFRRSIALTRGLTWKIIGITVLFGIVGSVAIMAAQFGFGSILRLVAGGNGDISVATVLTAILVGAVTTAFIVLYQSFIAKLYLAVRDWREAIVEADMNRGAR